MASIVWPAEVFIPRKTLPNGEQYKHHWRGTSKDKVSENSFNYKQFTLDKHWHIFSTLLPNDNVDVHHNTMKSLSSAICAPMVSEKLRSTVKSAVIIFCKNFPLWDYFSSYHPPDIEITYSTASMIQLEQLQKFQPPLSYVVTFTSSLREPKARQICWNIEGNHRAHIFGPKKTYNTKDFLRIVSVL